MDIIDVTLTTAVGRAAALALILSLAAPVSPSASADAPESAESPDLDLPRREEIEEHKSYDPSPELQQTASGGLIVNAFIMEGPVRVEIRDRHSGRVVMEKEQRSLFPFQVSREELGVEPTQVVVRIYRGGELAHQLDLLPER